MTDQEWTEVGGGSNAPTWDFNVNPTITGVLVRKQENVGPNSSMLYVVEEEDTNTEFGVWGSVSLDDRMTNVTVGDQVRIEYLGMQKNEKTGRNFKAYKVMMKHSDTVSLKE